MKSFRTLLLFVLFILIARLSEKPKDVANLQPIVTQNLKALPLKPEITQESINTALFIYNIKVPVWVKGVSLDTQYNQRGLTSFAGINNIQVKVGPSAFSSWGILASTLAHEIEIHSRQNLGLISLIDVITFSHLGTDIAERNAYNHELVNEDRFKLSKSEISSIKETINVDYFISKEKEESTIFQFASFLVATGFESPKQSNLDQSITIGPRKPIGEVIK